MFRTGTLLYIRRLSRATPTSSTCCFSTGPQPTSSLWLVHKTHRLDLHSPAVLKFDEIWNAFIFYLLCFLCITSSFCLPVTGKNGNTALSIARRLGYISVVDTLRPVTDENLATVVRHCLLVSTCLRWLKTQTLLHHKSAYEYFA